MDKTLIIVSAVIGSLGVLSAILGFSAEGTKLAPYDILVYDDDCIYPENPALGLGICAFIFLLAAQVTFAAVGSCCGCCKSRSIPSETKRIAGIVCAVASWIAAVIAWVLFIEGAAWSANVVREDAPYCPYLKDGIFAGAGVLSLAATALGIASYIMMRTQRQPKAAVAAAVPAKAGEPQLPPDAQGNNSNGSAAPNQEELPTHSQASPADEAQPPPATAASAPPEPVKLPFDPLAHVPVPAPTTQVQVGLEIPVIPSPPPPHPPAPAGNGSPALSTVIRNEVAKQGIRLAAWVVEHSLLSNNIAVPGVGDILVSMMTDSSTGDLQSADYGGAA